MSATAKEGMLSTAFGFPERKESLAIASFRYQRPQAFLKNFCHYELKVSRKTNAKISYICTL